jgi:hypothetical protein
MWRGVISMYTDVSEESVASIVTVEGITDARKSVRQEMSVYVKPTRRHIPESGMIQRHSIFHQTRKLTPFNDDHSGRNMMKFSKSITFRKV